MRNCLHRMKKLIWMLLLCAGVQVICLWTAAAEEVIIAEDAVFTDMLGRALPKAHTISTYSLRRVQEDWSYGAQLTEENQIAMYEALAGTKDMRAYSAENGIRVELPDHYLVEDASNRPADPDYVRFLRDYAKATHAYVRDFGESYWITSFGAGIAANVYNGTGIEITAAILKPKDYYDEIRDELGMTDAALDTALHCADGISDRYEKVKAAHDYVLEMVAYNHADVNAAYGHTITGGLLDKYNHLGVCECYAKLFRLICNANDIPCILITGGSSYNADGSVNANHMWNYVQMEDGQWYLADLTWDDMNADSSKYFLVGSDTTGSNHLPVGVFGTVSTTAGTVSYDAFAVPALSEKAYRKKALKSIILEKDEITLEVESEGKIEVSGCLPEYADVSDGYSYTSSNPVVVSVGSDGVLTAKKAGNATITVSGAECTYVTASCMVTVRDHVFSEIISEKAATCTQSGAQIYHCSNEGCEATQTKVIEALGHEMCEWQITKEATCTEAGEQKRTCTRCGEAEETQVIAVKGHTPGGWTTASAPTVLAEGMQEKRCTNCNAVLDTRKMAKVTATVTLNASSVPLQRKKSSTALAIENFTSGDAVDSWTSSKPAIVSVNKKTGKITAKKTGTAIITVTMKSGAKASCKVKVQSSVVKTKKLTVSKKAVKLAKGAAYTVKVVRNPITANDKLSFVSSNKKVATVSSKGKITAKKKGTAKITVKSGSKKATIKVTVK